MNDNQPTLCVDLDGSLVLTDTLYESVLIYVKENPLRIFTLPILLFKGRAFLKRFLSTRVDIDQEILPYNEELVQYLREQSHRSVVLVTAADMKIAQKVAGNFSFFTEYYGSDGHTNLKGSQKTTFLKEKFGQFDYVGDSFADVSVWKEARKAILVNPSSAIRAAVPNDKVEKIFEC